MEEAERSQEKESLKCPVCDTSALSKSNQIWEFVAAYRFKCVSLHLEKPSNDIQPICLMLDEGSNFCKRRRGRSDLPQSTDGPCSFLASRISLVHLLNS